MARREPSTTRSGKPDRSIAAAILRWYDSHKRDLPWRKTKDPYKILVSEIMLQQTQVDRVMPKYAEFTRKYPNLKTLSQAEPRDVRRIWYPLGYNARPMRLHAIAKETMAKYGGKLPKEPEQLDELPGIGRYTANAVASIAHGKKAAVVDTNVRRVLGRVVFGGRKVHDRRIWESAEALISDSRPGDFNQAVMDLGATICRPRNPDCPKCPLRRPCRFAA